VISAETARRNARAATHSTAREIRWLILHGVLHLLGYDHETDRGEMAAFELALRERLKI
jgi:probable rRNA maturation factor